MAYNFYVTHNAGDSQKDKTLLHSKKSPFKTERDALNHIMSNKNKTGSVHKVDSSGNIVSSRHVHLGQSGYPSDPAANIRHISHLKEGKMSYSNMRESRVIKSFKSYNRELAEAAVVTHKWYSVKHWKDGSEHFDNLDSHTNGEYKHPALGNTSRKRPDHHIGIPTKNKKAIAYMDKYAKSVNESVEQIDEISSDMKTRYAIGAKKDLDRLYKDRDKTYDSDTEKKKGGPWDKSQKKVSRRKYYSSKIGHNSNKKGIE